MAKSKRWSPHRRSVRRPVKPHADPGTITVDPLAPPPRMTLIAYGPQDFHEQEIKSVAEISQWRGRFPICWINVDGLGNADVIVALGKLFDLHPLALEDVVNTHQRAKTDDYGDVLFCVARMIQGPPLRSEQISFFIGRDFVLTFQEEYEGDSLEPVRQRLRQARGRIRSASSDYLLYELFDACIEGYFPLVENFGDVFDQLDRTCSHREVGDRLTQIHKLRGDLLYLRRIIWPHRDALQALMRSGHQRISSETQLYLRDCYDHVAQLVDILELYRENAMDLRDFYYTQLSNRTNEIMRVLTIISTLFLPMTFVAGVYGMNFEWMPELKWPWGYPASLLFMLMIALGFLVFFWRRGWLTSSETMSLEAEHDAECSVPDAGRD